MTELRDPRYSPSGNECLCRTCSRVFAGLKGFDQHRKNGACLAPDTVGLKLDWKGRWTSGSGEKRQLPNQKPLEDNHE